MGFLTGFLTGAANKANDLIDAGREADYEEQKETKRVQQTALLRQMENGVESYEKQSGLVAKSARAYQTALQAVGGDHALATQVMGLHDNGVALDSAINTITNSRDPNKPAGPYGEDTYTGSLYSGLKQQHAALAGRAAQLPSGLGGVYNVQPPTAPSPTQYDPTVGYTSKPDKTKDPMMGGYLQIFEDKDRINFPSDDNKFKWANFVKGGGDPASPEAMALMTPKGQRDAELARRDAEDVKNKTTIAGAGAAKMSVGFGNEGGKDLAKEWTALRKGAGAALRTEADANSLIDAIHSGKLTTGALTPTLTSAAALLEASGVDPNQFFRNVGLTGAYDPSAAQKFEKVSSGLVQSLFPLIQGRITNAEMLFFKKYVTELGKTPQANLAIAVGLKNLAARTMKENDDFNKYAQSNGGWNDQNWLKWSSMRDQSLHQNPDANYLVPKFNPKGDYAPGTWVEMADGTINKIIGRKQ